MYRVEMAIQDDYGDAFLEDAVDPASTHLNLHHDLGHWVSLCCSQLGLEGRSRPVVSGAMYRQNGA